MQAIKAAAAHLRLKNLKTDAIHALEAHNAQQIELDFAQHVAHHGLSFGTSEEYKFRMNEFAKKDAEIKRINAQGNSFTVGHNFMSTWTHDEYVQLLGYRGPKSLPEDHEHVVLDTVNIPTEIDWRTKGAVNPVQNQARCGSCWSFSATAAIEGHHFVKTGSLIKLSEQQFVDCDTASYGCNGGW